MNNLVTGCAGFIGASTAERLLQSGEEVTGLDNLNTYYAPALKHWRLARLEAYPRFRFIPLDLCDAGGLERLIASRRFDRVFNLGARAGVRASLADPHAYLESNVHGTLNLLESLRHHPGTKLVQASTSSLYSGQPLPWKESMPPGWPVSPYAASKLACEAYCATYHRLYGIDTSVVRYFTVYGPAGRPDMSIFGFIERILRGLPIPIFGDGQQSRDFTYIDDIAAGTLAAARPVGFEVFNLGGGREPVTLIEMIRSFERALQRNAVLDFLPPSAADFSHSQADNSKAANLLQWVPQVVPEDGFARTCQWHLSHRDLLAGIPV